MPSLNYATGVTSQPQSLYSSIGWFNFASLPSNISVNNSTSFTTTLANTILGGGSITARFTLSRTGTATTTTTFNARVAPTFNGATFGLTAYTGLTEKVCLQDITDISSPNFGIINVSNISIVNKYNQPITNYNFYFMDSETTQAPPSNEVFITDGSPWSIFYTPPANGADTTMSGIGTTIAQNTVQGNMPLLLTTNPSNITQTVTGGGAMSFGLSLTTAEMVKVVSNRINPNDQFQLDITGPNSGTTITVGQNTGVQSQGLQLISGSSGQSVFTFNESMAAGSVSNLSLYNPVVQVSNLSSGGSVLPSTINLGSSLTLNVGDYALVTITNAPAATSVTLNKTVNNVYCDLGSTLTYSIVVKNNSPYPVRDIVVTDTIPVNTTLLPSTVTLDGSAIAQSPAPPTGISVGTLPAGAVSTITFQVLVTNTLPSPNTVINNATTIFAPTISIGSVNSQTVVTTISTAQLTSNKTVSSAFANVGDILTYNVVFKNIGTTSANNIVFIDTIPSGTSLVSGSFRQDGSPISGSSSYPGVTLPSSISVGGTSTVTFQVRVNTMPTPNPIPNSASASYSYAVIPTVPNTSTKSVTTNTVNTQVNNASLGGIVKSVNEGYATCGTILTYTITLPNSGNVTAVNVVLKDTIPNGTSLVANSVTVNGVVQPIGTNPQTGINVGTISSGSSAVVSFQVTVNC